MFRCSLLLGGLAVLLTAACDSAEESPSPTPDSTATAVTSDPRGPTLTNVTVGTLRLVGSELHLVPCGSSQAGTALTDATGGDATAIVQELGPTGVTAIVVVEGDRLTTLHYAAPEGPGCETLPPTSAVEARGQEPFWYVSVSGTVATVRTPDELDGVEYTNGRWSEAGGSTWRYEASRGTDALTLELVRERCADGMSGARYPLKATLTRNGATMSGCALQGRGS